MAMINIDPSKDGTEHLNVSVDAGTVLGKMLSISFNRPFIEAESKITFCSLYQYLIWLNADKDNDVLALEAWNKYPALITNSLFGMTHDDRHTTSVMKVMREVIGGDPALVKMIRECDMPFLEYRILGTTANPIIIDETNPWYVNTLKGL